MSSDAGMGKVVVEPLAVSQEYAALKVEQRGIDLLAMETA